MMNKCKTPPPSTSEIAIFHQKYKYTLQAFFVQKLQETRATY